VENEDYGGRHQLTKPPVRGATIRVTILRNVDSSSWGTDGSRDAIPLTGYLQE
jgi:hypothetical protein